MLKLQDMQIGDQVHHKHYGTGKIISKTKETVTVEFRKRQCLFNKTKTRELELS